jgi:hypothetical protein
MLAKPFITVKHWKDAYILSIVLPLKNELKQRFRREIRLLTPLPLGKKRKVSMREIIVTLIFLTRLSMTDALLLTVFKHS